MVTVDTNNFFIRMEWEVAYVCPGDAEEYPDIDIFFDTCAWSPSLSERTPSSYSALPRNLLYHDSLAATNNGEPNPLFTLNVTASCGSFDSHDKSLQFKTDLGITNIWNDRSGQSYPFERLSHFRFVP